MLYRKVARLPPYSSAHCLRGLVVVAAALHQGECIAPPGRLEVSYFSIQHFSILSGSGTLLSIAKLIQGRLRRPSARPTGSYVESYFSDSSGLSEVRGLLLKEAKGNLVVADPTIWFNGPLFIERFTWRNTLRLRRFRRLFA